MQLARSRLLVKVGLALMVLGAVDPLEGSVVILGGSALVALAARLGGTGRHRLPRAALALIATGVAALFGLSALGGVGGDTGRSLWWLTLCAPYPIGWILGLAGAVRMLRDRSAPAA